MNTKNKDDNGAGKKKKKAQTKTKEERKEEKKEEKKNTKNEDDKGAGKDKEKKDEINERLAQLGLSKLPRHSTLLRLKCLFDQLHDLLNKCGEKSIS